MAAYRAPHGPHVARRVRRQTLAAQAVGFVLMWGLVGLMALVADRTMAPQNLFWKPLQVIDPVGAATRAKAARAGADPAACRAILAKGGLEFIEAPAPTEAGQEFCAVQDAVLIRSGMAPLAPADAPMTCKEALAVSIWERQVIQPAAYEHLGQGVVAVKNYGSYSCRRIYGKQAGPVSQHATANALDVSGFKLADGSDVMVARDWSDPGPKGAFLRAVRDGACKVFLTTLSPDYNAAHADHLHLDMGGWPKCS